jgi:hypothetical protein
MAKVRFELEAEAVLKPEIMETLIEPWSIGLFVSTSMSSARQEIVLDSPEQLEITLSPDHLERPRLTMQKFNNYFKRQDLMLKRQLAARVGGGFHQMQPTDVALGHNLSMLLSHLNPGAVRKVRNRSLMAIRCRIYDAHRCNPVTDVPVLEAIVRPFMTISLPKNVSIVVFLETLDMAYYCCIRTVTHGRIAHLPMQMHVPHAP